MSKHRTRINGRTEFVFRCDKCGYETDSIAHKDFRPPVCPVCKEEIGQERGADLPDNTRGRSY
jgi:rubrerythrin